MGKEEAEKMIPKTNDRLIDSRHENGAWILSSLVDPWLGVEGQGNDDRDGDGGGSLILSSLCVS